MAPSLPAAARLPSAERTVQAVAASRVVNGVRFIDAAALWRGVDGVALRLKLRELLEAAGVQFWDGAGGWLVKRPTVAVCSIGGLPVSHDASTPPGCVRLGGQLHPVAQLSNELRSGMGLAGLPTYMNPGGKTAVEMFGVLCSHGHFSVGHGAALSFFVAGLSCAVENELNSQRDLVHLARLTVARTAAQRTPPLVVQHEALVPVFASLRQWTVDNWPPLQPSPSQPDGGIPPSCSGRAASADWNEAAHLLWPSAKAHVAVMSGTLRAFQKLVAAIDAGKEAEYRYLLRCVNDSLHALLPEMYRPTASYELALPHHYAPPSVQG
jgi:hypothetical protein